MANRFYNQFQGSLEKNVVTNYVTVIGAAAAAPTKVAGRCKGLKTITYNGVGDVTYTFDDNFNALLAVDMHVLSVDGINTPTVADCWVKSFTKATTGCSVRIVTFLSAPGTPADASTNAQLMFEFIFSNSSAP